MGIEDTLDRTCEAAEAMWEKAQEKDKLIETLRQRAEKAEAEAAAKQNILNAIECNAASAMCNCAGCGIYTLAHGSDECANKTCPVMLRGIELAKEHAAKHKAMQAMLLRISKWDALDIPDSDGQYWKNEIDQVLKEKP